MNQLTTPPISQEVAGFLNQRPLAVAVRALFGIPPQRIVVQRYHVERYGVTPDAVRCSLLICSLRYG